MLAKSIGRCSFPVRKGSWKRIIFFMVTFVSFYNGTKSQPLQSFRIQGKLNSDSATGNIYLHYPLNESWITDSSRLSRGAFSFQGHLSHPVLGSLVYKDSRKEIFLESADISVIDRYGRFEDAETMNSSSQNEYNEVERKIKQIKKRWKPVLDTLYAVNKRSNAAFQELKEWVLKPYFEDIIDVYLDFFTENPQSYVTAYFLSVNVIEMNQGRLPVERLQLYYDHFVPAIKQSRYGRKIVEEISKRKVAVPGAKAIDFTRDDMHGLPVSLSSLRGKYVLLDFWGSWCIPCRKGNPHLKELYVQYKDRGFDIIGIAADNNSQSAWRKAIAEDELPWRNMLIGDLESAYHITSYPTRILIDKEGMIIGRFGTEDRPLDEMLIAIFK